MARIITFTTSGRERWKSGMQLPPTNLERKVNIGVEDYRMK
jgi:hypothetical protein